MENTTRINMPTLKADDIIEKAAVARVQELDTLINNMADSLSKASSGKNLSKYWKTQDELIKDVITSYKTFNKVSNESNATELIKVTNALKAIVGVDLSNILPDFDGFAKSFNNAKKKVGNLDSAFDVKGFKEAFDVFETLKQQGLNVQEVFSHFGQNTNISELQKNVRALENEVENLTQRLTYAHDENKELRAEFNNFKTGSGLSNIMDELDDANSKLERLRNEAVETFENFLKLTNVAPKRTDQWGMSEYDFNDYRFQDYFQRIKDGSMTAQEAIADFKLQYDYLLKDSESNNNMFGLEQLQAFSTTLDSIFRQVEETSLKINDIISNGVIAKSVQNLSTDTTLSDSQRSLFGNLLQDEESLKSITTLFQKLIEESNQTKNTEMFNSEQFVKIEELFTNIESHLSSIKSVLVDVGDGEELSPLLKQLDNIREATSNIKLSLNLDFGNEISEKLNQKISQITTRQLEAYRKLFSAMKGTGKTNKEMLNFYEPENASTTELIGMYQSVIKRARNHFKVGDNDIYEKLLGSTYKDLNREIDNASRQLSNAENKRPDSGILRDLFGNSKDLSGIVEQLNIIVSKLDEISISATKFSEVFKDGLNITTSVEEITTLTNKVKELETELERVKSVSTTTTTSSTSTQKTNISSGTKDAFPSTETKLDKAVTSAKDLDKTLEQVDIPTDSFDKVLEKLDRTKSELVDIVKITKQSVSDAEGKFHDSYTLKDSRGSTEIYGVNSKTDKGQILRQNIVGYDEKKDTVDNSKAELEVQKQITAEIEASNKANQKKWQSFQKEQADYEKSVNKVNNAIKETDKLLNNLPIHDKLDSQFMTMVGSVEKLNEKLKSGGFANISEYEKEVKSLISEYSKMFSIQQKRDVEEHNAGVKADNAKKLEEEKKEWNDLNTSIDRYATLQRRIASNNALSTDKEEAAGLLAHIKELQEKDILSKEKTDASKQRLEQIDQMVADLKAKLKESTLDSLQGSIDKYQRAYNNYSVRPANEQSGEYRNALINLNSAIQELEKYKATLSGMSEVTENQEAHIEKLVSECAKASDAFKQMSASQKGAKEIGIAKSIQRINKDLAENTRYSKTAKQNLQALLNQLESGDPSINLEKINSEIIKIENAEIRAGRAGKSFLDIFKTKAVHGFLGQAQSYLSMYIGFYGMVNKVRSTITTVKELDTALVDLKKTTTMTEQQLNKFYYSSNNVARQMGVTTQEIIEQASAWSRLGYSSNEAATEMAKLSSQFASISPGMDTDESQSGLVSIMKAWSINPDDVKSQIMDPINKLGKLLPKHTVMYGAIKYSIVDNYIG